MTQVCPHCELSNDEFKNFHRALCERFGYGHDQVDWKRDQISLIEHIAKRIDAMHEALAYAVTIIDHGISKPSPEIMQFLSDSLAWSPMPRQEQAYPSDCRLGGSCGLDLNQESRHSKWSTARSRYLREQRLLDDLNAKEAR